MEDTYEKYLIRKASQVHIPISTTFELTPLCNMNCDMCYVRMDKTELNTQGRVFRIQEWVSVARQMANQGTLFVLLTGGEPLLFPKFQELYLELKKLGMVISINTNGTLIDQKWADFFCQYKPRRINITLYGCRERAYSELCHYSGGFQKVIKGIKLLKDRGIDIKINSSITKVNRGDFEAIYKLGKELDIPVFTDTYMLPGRRERQKLIREQVRLRPEEAARLKWNVLQKEMPPDCFRQYVQSVLGQIKNDAQSYSAGINCQASLCSCTVDWKGRLRPCVTLEEPFVDLREYCFDEAWKELSQQSQKLFLNKKCGTCSLRPICQICVGCAWVETGHYDGVPEYLCACTNELFRLFQKEGEMQKNESGV